MSRCITASTVLWAADKEKNKDDEYLLDNTGRQIMALICYRE